MQIRATGLRHVVLSIGQGEWNSKHSSLVYLVVVPGIKWSCCKFCNVFLRHPWDILAASHARTCDFPTEHGDVRIALENKSTPVVLENDGTGAPRVRTNVNARTAADPYFKRVPVDGISPHGPAASSTASSPGPSSSPAPSAPSNTASASASGQTTLQDNWGAGRIATTRQVTIDYFLLRVINCCALAFSLLDNGFRELGPGMVNFTYFTNFTNFTTVFYRKLQ
ncbi:hypothetical protein C8R45DRAFT_1136989 [Mycena sanguinolenta]|nr:hypothetical protein C8R45DRAFT_1136989 [Mycena sanguinolenta]